MNRCDCDCARDLRHLEDQVRSLEYRIDAMQRDVQRELSRLEARTDALRSDLEDMQA